MERKRKKRAVEGVSAGLEQRLKSYALMAAAAGAGALALPATANASVVYVPTTINLIDGTAPLDLDGDGVTDFTFIDQIKLGSLYSNRTLQVSGGVTDSVVKSLGGAADMKMGSAISSGRVFEAVSQMPARMVSIGYRCASTSACHSFKIGKWKQTKNNYVGFKFTGGDGQTHFGWARLNTTFQYKTGGGSRVKVYISGYAYETTAGGSIKAGQTTGADAAGSLGQLAIGAAK